jgi:arylsulfatase A-like enzyme
VIFIGDNGTPGPIQDANVGNRGSKSSVWQGGVHVPLVIAGAGVTRQNVRQSDIVVSSDLYATIAELAGIPVAQINNSYSLVPLLTDGSATSGRTHGFTEICGFGGNNYAIRDARYKLLYHSSQGGFGLYDLQTDPLEQNNRYNDPGLADVRTALETEIAELKGSAQTNEGCFQ